MLEKTAEPSSSVRRAEERSPVPSPSAQPTIAVRAGTLPSAMSPADVVALQRTLGNRAVQHMLVRSARVAAPAAGPIQRHPGHPPSAISPRRQHYNAAMALLEQTLNNLTPARQEFVDANSHGANAHIQAWIAWTIDMRALRIDALTKSGARQWVAAMRVFRAIRQRYMDKGFPGTSPVFAEIDICIQNAQTSLDSEVKTLVADARAKEGAKQWLAARQVWQTLRQRLLAMGYAPTDTVFAEIDDNIAANLRSEVNTLVADAKAKEGARQWSAARQLWEAVKQRHIAWGTPPTNPVFARVDANIARTRTGWQDEVNDFRTRAQAKVAAKDWKGARQLWQALRQRYVDEGYPPTDPVFAELDGYIGTATANHTAAKQDKYLDRGQKLFDAGDFAHAAVLWERAHEIQANQTLALEIAKTYEKAGDKERAVNWYRKLVTSPTYSGNATKALHKLGFAATPKHRVLKEVDKRYTSTTKANLTQKGAEPASLKGLKESGKYAEEQQTKFLSEGVGDILMKMLTGKIVAAQLPALETSLRDNMGVNEITLKNLFFEFARFQHSRGIVSTAKILSDVQRLYPTAVLADVTTGGYATLESIMTATVKYLTTTAERDAFKLVKHGGLIKQGDPPGPDTGYDTKDQSTNASGRGYAIFVMSADGNIYTNTHKVDRFHHSSFLAGSEAAGAGEVKITAGVLKEISNKSGHYQPGREHLVQSIKQFKELGPVAGATVRFHTAKGKIKSWTGGPDDFIASSADDVTFNQREAEEVARQGGWKK